MPRRFVLASASPARLKLLVAAGIEPEVIVSDVDEDAVRGEDVRSLVLDLAERKAGRVAGLPAAAGALVLGCDSMLDVDGAPFGKPGSPAEAVAWLRAVRGREALLHTGHCLIDTATGERSSEVATTVVRYGSPSDAEIDAYVATGEPLSVAGAFTLDGRSGPFVDGVDGDPSNVIGCSLPLLRTLLLRLGVTITDLWA